MLKSLARHALRRSQRLLLLPRLRFRRAALLTHRRLRSLPRRVTAPTPLVLRRQRLPHRHPLRRARNPRGEELLVLSLEGRQS